MNKAVSAYQKAYDELSDLIFRTNALLNESADPLIRARAGIDPNWGDVGTLCHLIEKAVELHSEVLNYVSHI